MTTLEWTHASAPPAFHNFDVVPTVVRGPHEYANPEVKRLLKRDWIDQVEPLAEAECAAPSIGGGGRGDWRHRRRVSAMGNVVALRPRAPADFTQSLGMIVALGSWAMMFGGLFFIYFGMRAQVAGVAPGGRRLACRWRCPRSTRWCSLASSVALWRGRLAARPWRAARARAVGGRRASSSASRSSGSSGVVWRQLWAAGLLPSSGAYGSVVLRPHRAARGARRGGPPGAPRGALRALRGMYTEHNVIRVRVAAMFWHFVDAVWLLMFVSLYLF